MTAEIREPALHVFVFAPLLPDSIDPGHALANAWSAASKLGLTEPTPGLDYPVDLPAEIPCDDVWFRVVAAKADADGHQSAIAFTAHDVAAVAMRLRTQPGHSWDELDDGWHEAAGNGESTGALGVAHVYTGVTDQPATALVTTAADDARNILTRNSAVGLELVAAVEPDIALWEMEKPWGRAVVVLAGPKGAATQKDWCWLTTTNDDIARYVRYLMHASKLRFEIGVFQDDMPRLREQERKLDAGLAELFAMHKRFEASGAAANELIDAQSRLGRAQGDAAGLLISITHLRDLRQTVEIANHNLRQYAPESLAGAPTGISPFSRELDMAGWLERRIGHEIAYLESCRERVAEAQALTDLRLKQIAAAHARTANWLTVLQTSVVGALIGALGVATALGEHFEVSQSVRAAVMVLVAAMALVLPPLAVRWAHGYRWPELAAAGAVGAAAGWTAAVGAAEADWLGATTGVILASAALGAAVFASAASLANNLRSPRRPSGS